VILQIVLYSFFHWMRFVWVAHKFKEALLPNLPNSAAHPPHIHVLLQQALSKHHVAK